ncbi:glycerol uptake facilitator protein [Granulicella pectinivorans]|uniref:Glycerol uptake facilitator protein n=1 Tax=Granulicella pectinivorans TaxID=474950 RepID=A0A1I6LUA0_9BACT|nr:MIP/aquaporin family protein [Granulicella pectinivorans]SFS06852.1 glycerol uptake facilitator protein [Granulicella pectinivorans]
MLTPFFGEFMGTLVIILLGEGTNAAVSLKGSKAENSGWIVVAAGWGFAVFCGVITAIACGSPGAHLNPAVTIAVAIKTGDYSSMLSFFAAQFLGAFVGAVLVWLFYKDHFAITEDQGTKLGVFCTAPAIRNPLSNLFSEVLGTAVLLLVIGCIGAKTFAPAGPAPGLAPYLVGILVWAIGLGLGGTTGYAINPARDLGPRTAHALLPIPGKGGSDWGYAWIPVVGPVVGAILIGLFLRLSGI